MGVTAGRLGAALAVAGVVAVALPTRAVPPSEMPWADTGPRYLAEQDVVRSAAVGAPDPRLGRLSAVELRARYEGERRARAAIHRWVDDAMAEARVMPWSASGVHRAIEGEASVAGIRPMVDGGAVVLVEVPAEALRAAADVEGAPWQR